MKLFTCDQCGQLVFFENQACLRCGAHLAYDDRAGRIRSLRPGEAVCSGGDPVCTWIADAGGDGRCRSCQLTTLHPDPASPAAGQWSLLERAKRRLLHTLLQLGLPIDGMRFAFPAEGLTGHADGLITVVLAEADDVERERRRVSLHEPQRTLIGHFRHESGHHYFDRLVLGSERIDGVRQVFGDERADYGAALQRHYAEGAPADWSQRHVSAYASSHPFEDWAETWAHLLLMVDGVEIAGAYGLSLTPHAEGAADGISHAQIAINGGEIRDFDRLLAAWYPLTWFATSLTRSAGLPDWYPFAPSATVLGKLRLVHDIAIAGDPLRQPAPLAASA